MSDKILILAYHDQRGDGMATYWLTRCLREAGMNAVLMILHKSRNDDFIYTPAYLVEENSISLGRRVVNKLGRMVVRSGDKVAVNETPDFAIDPKYDFIPYTERRLKTSAEDILRAIPFVPDLIISGLTSNFTNTTTLAELKELSGADIYQLTVDMQPFTGGCHHSWGCEGYLTDCANCPAILDPLFKDHARQTLQIKKENVRRAGIRILAGSGRTLMQAKKSALYGSQTDIPNINSFIDRTVFNEKNRSIAKQVFHIPTTSKVIFAGAENSSNPRKGFTYFIEALEILWDQLDVIERENTFILIVGKPDKSDKMFDRVRFQKLFVNYITDERLLSLAYQAADVFACPSIEEPGPLMVTQAMACGTPVVGFEMGLLYNMVMNGYNGYKAPLMDSKALASGLKEVLTLTPDEFNSYSANAIAEVEKQSSVKVVVDVIKNILDERKKSSYTTV